MDLRSLPVRIIVTAIVGALSSLVCVNITTAGWATEEYAEFFHGGFVMLIWLWCFRHHAPRLAAEEK